MDRLKTRKSLEASRLMRFATTLDPGEIIADHDGVIRYVLTKANDLGVYTAEPLVETVFSQGLKDVKAIVKNAFTDHGATIPLDRALKIVDHDITVDTIGRYADLPESFLGNIIDMQRAYNDVRAKGFSAGNERDFRVFIVDEISDAIIVNPHYEDGWDKPVTGKGCPFAQPAKEGCADRLPLFDNFVRWAGKIAVYTS